MLATSELPWSVFTPRCTLLMVSYTLYMPLLHASRNFQNPNPAQHLQRWALGFSVASKPRTLQLHQDPKDRTLRLQNPGLSTVPQQPDSDRIPFVRLCLFTKVCQTNEKGNGGTSFWVTPAKHEKLDTLGPEP